MRLENKVERLERERAKQARPKWRSVHICEDDGGWCVSDPTGIHYGQGEPFPECFPGDAVFITNISVDAL